MFGLGAQELMIIFGIVVVLFGAKRLPQLGSGIGQGIRNFKQGIKHDEEESPRLDEEKKEKQEEQ
ncbi:MAG: twin-arginine translocase TatA/TatE family subunit [Desulfuromonadaceae bacterium]